MAMQLEINLKQGISQNMLQSIEILQMSTQELEAYVEALSMENPVIELPEYPVSQLEAYEVERQRKLEWLESADWQNRVYYSDERRGEDREANWSDGLEKEEELSDYLLAQLLLEDYTVKERKVLEFIVRSLDSRGYFLEELSFVAKYFSISEAEAKALLLKVQSLDPAGVGARNLQECLVLQLDRMGLQETLVEQIIRDFLPEFGKNHICEIAKKLHVLPEEIQKAGEVIRRLNPKPGNAFASRDKLPYLSPDAVVIKLEDYFEILINEYRYPQFSISSFYEQLEKTTEDGEVKTYLGEKFRQAEWVQNCISLRVKTLSELVRILVEKQREFFIYGIGYKKPMDLKSIAQELNLHESTVSRAMHNKYLQCSWGIFPFNYFLTYVATKSEKDGEEKTAEEVKRLLKEVVDQEDKSSPLSDEAIARELLKQGIKISRRTVNKYRTSMGLADKKGRREWRNGDIG
jgi:RNA polymerase sigma-54 factor